MFYSKELILLNVKISDIAEKVGVQLTEVNSGNFTHRCKCPGKDHKSGTERTGSLYIDDINNNFYCFGCSASNNAIDFYILCTGTDFLGSIKELSDYVDPTNLKKAVTEHKQNIFSVLLDISHYLRELQLSHPDDREWLEKMLKRTDGYISKIDRYDMRSAKKLERDIKRVSLRRYIKK